jgi:hypothetical protein
MSRPLGTRRSRPLRALSSLAAVFSVVAVLAPAGAVSAPSQQTTASISGQADWIHNFSINVYVTVQGFGGPGGLNVQVNQATPFGPATGGGFTPIFCDGTRNTYAVGVFGMGPGPGFVLGEALATAQAFCPSPFPPGTDTQTIRITRP